MEAEINRYIIEIETNLKSFEMLFNKFKSSEIDEEVTRKLIEKSLELKNINVSKIFDIALYEISILLNEVLGKRCLKDGKIISVLSYYYELLLSAFDNVKSNRYNFNSIVKVYDVHNYYNINAGAKSKVSMIDESNVTNYNELISNQDCGFQVKVKLSEHVLLKKLRTMMLFDELDKIGEVFNSIPNRSLKSEYNVVDDLDSELTNIEFIIVIPNKMNVMEVMNYIFEVSYVSQVNVVPIRSESRIIIRNDFIYNDKVI